jgi:hypothetical protein
MMDRSDALTAAGRKAPFPSPKGLNLTVFFTFTLNTGNETERESSWINVRG